ncbi:MAG: VWA domain-containing protein [Phycisphaeraceae bacterium]|nr:VWA domain-containing protein [Phycisphaeraceae bacterium]
MARFLDLFDWFISLFGDADRVASPQWLWALLAIPALAALWVRRARRGALRTAVASRRAFPRSWRTWCAWVPGVTCLVAYMCLVIAAARPQLVRGERRMSTEGVAIEMVIDRSASMTAPMMYGGERLTRFEVVKRVFTQFVEGDGGSLRGRAGDMIGLTAFAGYADTICPLVRSHETLVALCERMQPAPPTMPEGGTAIGDGLALAAARLKSAEDDIIRLNRQSDAPPEFTIKSKVIILLTDGEHNRGELLPDQAAELAKDWGIKIYTIGIGGTGGIVYIPGPTRGSRVPIRDWVDEATLSRIAEGTGGVYWNARDAETLRKIYSQLSELEQTTFETVEYTNVEEKYHVYARLGMVYLVLGVLLRWGLLRRGP